MYNGELFSQRPNCTIYQLRNKNGLFLLKYFKGRKEDSLAFDKKRLETAEYIARRMKEERIATVCAIEEDLQYIHQKDQQLYAIYPWIDGKVLTGDEINQDTCYEIGKRIGKIHKLELRDESISIDQYKIEGFSELKYDLSMENATILKAVNVLNAYRSKLEMLMESDKMLIQNKRNILCHKDTGPSNFLFYKSEYYLIDWEHAGYEYPEFELFDTCLEWSDFRNHTNWTNYRQVVKGYYSEVSYKEDIPYEALIYRMILSILRRIDVLLLDYFQWIERDCFTRIESYLFQLAELEKNKQQYIDNLKPY